MPRAESETIHLNRRARRMRRYSRAVVWMKVLLPLGAVALVALIFFTGRDRTAVADLEAASTAAALGAGMRLESPRFAGATETGEPFVIAAGSALPDGATPNRVDLEEPTGEIWLGDGRRLAVRARSGAILREDEILYLDGRVVLETSDGYRATTDSVEIELDSRSAKAPGRISADGPRGGIDADALTVTSVGGDGNALVFRFEGNVRVRFQPAE